ncbi:HEAT repeat domain-containing protein [Oscillatoriales cyanobacterium LEGE 11467]|uniref:HEAT repeat domain-containing protein n=2 Tax=Zarconia TaxID=2992130 RepID=A0A928VTV4_9CYAN|nr:HEAT repeat domain-containing protein [Zarconia navalis LEGE 11467]
MSCLALGVAPVRAAKLQTPTSVGRLSFSRSTSLSQISEPIVAQTNPPESPNSETLDNAIDRSTDRAELMWWLAGVAGVVVVAAGFLYLFLKLSRPGAIAEESPDQKLDSIAHRTSHPSKSSAISPTIDRQEQLEEVDLTSEDEPISAHGNGTNNGALPHSSIEGMLTIEETTPLAKINIVDALIQELQNPDPAKRRKAIWELGQRGDSRAIQPLVDLMLDSDSSQRSLILAVLSEIGTRTLKPMNRALAVSLQDDSAEGRKNAIRDLTRIYDVVAQMSQLLNHAIDDSDGEVSDTAQWALSQLNRIRSLGGRGDLPSLPRATHSSENTSGLD